MPFHTTRILCILPLIFGPAHLTSADAEEVNFTKQIKPILERSCVKCHNPEKTKGELQLHTQKLTLEGGSSGPAVVPEKPEESPLYKRISVPKDDLLHMPAEGESLSEEEQKLIHDWIKQGAPWPEEVALKIPGAAGEKDVPRFAREPLTENDKKAMAQIEKLGGQVLELAQNDHRLDVAYHLANEEITDKNLAPLSNLERVAELNLRETAITDKGLAHLKNLSALRRLHLEKTAVTDKGLQHLKELKNLRYLNLFGTQVTDKGLEKLTGLENLEKVYLWQTKVTDAGVKKLKKALPNAQIIRGLELATKKAGDDKKDNEKKEDKK